MSLRRAGYRWVTAATLLVGAWPLSADERAGVVVRSQSTADTLETALVQAYQNNPQVNAQRALVRATDENVPQALAGYRPRISGTYS